jgi:hypothetical protein
VGSATFVTSLYDIGRESWPAFNRSFSHYLRRFQHLLAVDINLVVFGESSLKDFVRKHRQIDEEEEGSFKRTKKKTRHGHSESSQGVKSPSSEETVTSSRTQFVTLPFKQLPAAQHMQRLQYVLTSEDFVKDNDMLLHRHPQALYVQYLVIVHSKAALVGQVTLSKHYSVHVPLKQPYVYSVLVDLNLNACHGRVREFYTK